MDFSLEEPHAELRTLTADLLAREASVERVTTYEQSGTAYDRITWKAMAQAGLLALVLPEDEGGQGFGAVELAVVLAEVGRRAAPVPALACLALGALPVARFGTPEQRRALLPAVAEGESVLTAAIREPDGAPPVTARPDGASPVTARPDSTGTGREHHGRYLLDGAKVAVPYASVATKILVTAGDGVYLVDPADVTLTPSHTSHGHPESRVQLSGTPAERLGDAPAEFLVQHHAAALCATGTGVLGEALRLTTEHVRTREQFGRPIATFQAAAGEVADVYIASSALDAATASACWRLSTGRDARAHLGVAAYWLAEHGVKALHTCQHLHGGIGVDITYPLHRYFAWTRHLAHTLGGAGYQLEALGALVGDGAGEVA